ncbi:MAG: penicillin-binding protein 2 [Propionibacteriaceae bacterium]|nr:penicillin-binding protein 2 [Propionibacteriaceae bacterium]
MNGPIRVVSVTVLVMFFALMANLTYSATMRQTSLNENTQNRRVSDARFAQDRGPIMVGNTPIAESQPVKDRYKFQREYSNGPLYAPVTGFYAYSYGSSALESSQSRFLSGATDQQVLEQLIKSAAGQVPKGATVETTISAKAQKAAWKALDGRKGAVVALDYRTGAVRALVTSPSYDPAELATHDLAASKQAWERLNADADKPMANRATREIYAPGSTFKLITAAAALENGYTSDSSIDASSYQLPGSTKRINGSCGGAKITLGQALRVSCNPGFARLGAKLGADVMQKQAEAFGFGQRYLPEIGSVASRFPEDIDSAQTAMSAIGEYEVAATPLQMAMVAAAIANDGVVMQPYVVDRVLSADLALIQRTAPAQASIAVSGATAAQLRQMMVSVVESGTGRRAQIPGVEVGGKTGTAVTDRERLPYAWFVAYAKEYGVAVAVFIEDADISASEVAGGRVSAPVAKAVLEALK